jgi:hypothetical protein
MMDDEEVDDFGGLESSVARVEDARMGAAKQPVPQADPGRDPAAAAPPSQVAGSCYGHWVYGFIFVLLKVGCCVGSDVRTYASNPY